MAASPTFKIAVDGLPQLRRKLKADEAYAEEWHDCLEDIAKAAVAAGARVAPRGKTGKTASSMTYKLSAKTTVMSARVVNTARNKGYPYPKLLEYSPKHGHQRWLLHALDSIRGHVTATLNGVGRRIERRWSS